MSLTNKEINQECGTKLTAPICSYRKIDRVTPSAVMTRLVYMKTVEKVEPAKIIEQTIDFQTHTVCVGWIDVLLHYPEIVLMTLTGSYLLWKVSKKKEIVIDRKEAYTIPNETLSFQA